MAETEGGAPAPKLRDLIARVNQRVRDVRLDEQGAPVIPSATRIGWSSRVEPKRPKSRAGRELEQQRKERREANRRNWQRRHPDLAAAERNLRIERVAVIERWDHKREGTPATYEAVRRGRAGAIARLYQTGTLNDDELAYAQQISDAIEMIAADVMVRAASLQSRVDAKRAFDDTFFESLARVQLEVAYGNWRQWLGSRAAPVLDIIAGDVGLTIAARRHRLSHRKLAGVLVEALAHWPSCLAAARREVDPATLIAAQAAIL